MSAFERVKIHGFGTLVLDCPDPRFNVAALNDIRPGVRDNSRFGVTELSQNPQERFLRRTRWEDIIVLASDQVVMKMGTFVHDGFERQEMKGWVNEYKVESEWVVDGEPVTIVTKIDSVQWHTPVRASVWDLKTGTNYGAMNDPKEDYVAQVNIGAENLRRVDGCAIESLHLSYWVKNHQKGSWQKQADGPNVVQDIPIWSREQCVAWVEERVRLHRAAEEQHGATCANEERWLEDKWAVKKKGRKTAVKVFDSSQEAGEWLEQQNDRSALSIEYRPGKPRKCMFYCGAASVCPQFQAESE